MSKEVLDVEELKERVQNDIELMFELFEIFIEDYGPKRITLEESLKGDDFEEVRNIAHSLKGASGNISAKELNKVLLEFEEMGSKNNSTGFEALLIQLDTAYSSLTARIEELKQESAS